MRYAVKNKKKIVKAYQLGAGTKMEKQLIAEDAIRLREDGSYELFSQESKNGGGQIAQKGDYFKVDIVDGRSYPYQNEREWFEKNHTHICGDEYEQQNKPVKVWECGESEDEVISFLLRSGKIIINENDEERYYNAHLFGADLSAAKDALVIIYSAKKNADGSIASVDYSFISRKEFEASYSWE